MPTKLPWSKNRSHASIDTSSGHPSPIPSGNPSSTAVNDPNAQQQQQQQQQQQPLPPQQQQTSPRSAQGAYQQQYPQPQPQRTSSHRHSANISLDQQSYDQQAYEQQPPRAGSYQPQQAYAPEPPVKQKQGFRARLGLGSHKEEEGSNKQSAKADKIGRRKSVRKSDTRVAQEYQAQQEQSRLQAAQWTQRQGGSNTNLPASTELDEQHDNPRDSNLDPFLQREDIHPQVPPKDNYPAHPPPQYSHSQNPSQDQFRPPVARVNTEGSYHTPAGGVNNYSPDHSHQGLTPQHQQQQYQTYHPPAPQQQQQQQQQQNSGEYQAFHPKAPSPLITNAQLHPPDHTGQQQNYYHYQGQQQPPQQVQQPSPLAPQDPQAQNTHYPQPSQYSPQSQPHQGQDFQQQVRGHSLPQPELKAPPPTSPHPLIVQGGQPIDNQHSQQLRPPSSQAHIAPPSPLQPQTPSFQAYDPQQTQQPHVSEPRSRNTTPPQQTQTQTQAQTQAQTQTQDSMPAANQRNTLRKVNDAGQPPSGPPTRESSLLSQNPAQGQAQGQPPPSPGLHQTFGANVVPTASQGQPYRGEKGQSQSNSEMGRATPPPRSASDMSDDEVNALVKEHEVLREKYQKVKRYFFEQQSQVHQLQNTLANQRMSLSRTSWDDSEYATRFNRLDGLIAQLSFAIRKDWKSIPPWLHTAVNKTAVETGKQEMTAVGRAFISCWLVEKIFDKYFHPDLEVGLSTQLKTIQLNIRKNAPVAHSAEDEEGLIAKVVNWRLATLEGLADMLNSNSAAAHRETLTDKLNEQLIAELQMYLNDPAPADITGGVPMIVELAISVAQHLPLESREVHIEYFYPGAPVIPDFMKLESGIPALTVPIEHTDDADRASVRSVVSRGDDSASIAEQEQAAQQAAAQQQASQPTKDHSKKHSIFGFGSSKKPSNPASLGKRETALGQGGSQQSLSQPPSNNSGGVKEDAPPPKVRLSVGVAVQIRGKSILIKAPVYTT